MIINNHKIIIKINNFENFEIIFWNQKPKTPSDGTCLGEPLGGFCVVVHFWCCVSSFIFICWCFSFCWCCISIWFSGYFAMSPALHSGFSDPWRPPPALSSNLDYFWLPLLFHLPPALRFWVGIFYPQAFFTLCSFPTFLAHSQHFGTTCFYQGFTGSRQLLSWKLQGFILILKTQTRPICLFDSQ